jgi:hypothetical protein
MIKTPLVVSGTVLLVIGALAGGAKSVTLGLQGGPHPPGVGLAALSFFDLLVIYAFVVIALEVAGLGALTGRAQGFTALTTGVLGALAGLILTFSALALLNQMLALIQAPLGLPTYLALFGHFDTAASREILSVIMCLKLIGLALILLGVPSLLRNRKLLILVCVSLGFTFVLGLVDAYVPGFLISLFDALAGVVIGAYGLVRFVLLAFAGLSSLLKAARGAVLQ